MPEALHELADKELPAGEKWGIETIGLWKHDISILSSTCDRLFPLLESLRRDEAWKSRAEEYRRGLWLTKGIADELAKYAEEAELLKQLSSINKDVLGVYRATAGLFPDRGNIELYWVVIGAIARLRGIDAGSLAVVVMAHELAHAYTHLGLDSNGSRWEEGFWDCDHGILEGLAQYYTHKAVEALKYEKGYFEVWNAYEELTRLQKENGATRYTKHLEWVNDISPEAMRHALLDIRRGHLERKLEKFSQALQELARRYPV